MLTYNQTIQITLFIRVETPHCYKHIRKIDSVGLSTENIIWLKLYSTQFELYSTQIRFYRDFLRSSLVIAWFKSIFLQNCHDPQFQLLPGLSSAEVKRNFFFCSFCFCFLQVGVIQKPQPEMCSAPLGYGYMKFGWGQLKFGLVGRVHSSSKAEPHASEKPHRASKARPLSHLLLVHRSNCVSPHYLDAQRDRNGACFSVMHDIDNHPASHISFACYLNETIAYFLVNFKPKYLVA